MVAELLTVPRVLTDRAFDRLVVEEVERRVATTRATRCYSNIGTLPAALADWGRVAAVGARWLPGAPPPTPFVGVLGVGFGGAVTVTVAASMQTIADPVAAAFVARLGTSVDELLGAADR
jgi:hypothetical protein